MSRPVVPIANLSRRLPELGRIKDGVKVAGKGQPKAIDTLRFTSQDPKALAQVAAHLGGEVVPYSDPRSTDTHELLTPSAECPVILPPDPLGGTPMYEMYSGGGRERWCDGVTCEQWRKGPDGPEPFEVACPCAAKGELACKPTVHLSVILGFTRMGGTWRWTTHSYNAAVELPGMVEAIQALQSKGLTRGVLRVDSRTQVLAGVTRKFKVPVLGVDATADELASGQASFGALPAPPTAALAPPPVAQIEAGEGPTPPGNRADASAPPRPASSGGERPVPPPGSLPLDVDVTGGGARPGSSTEERQPNEAAGTGSTPAQGSPPSGGHTLTQLDQALLAAAGRPTIPASKTVVLRAAAGHGHTGTYDELLTDEALALAVLAELGGTLPTDTDTDPPPADLTPWKQQDEKAWDTWRRRCNAMAGPGTKAKPHPRILDEDKGIYDEQRHALAYGASRKVRGEGREVTSWGDLTGQECRMIEETLRRLGAGEGFLTFGDTGSPGGWVVESKAEVAA